MADHQQRFEIIIQKLRDHGHKITPQRLAIVAILTKSDGHPSVEDIHAQVTKSFPTMSLATVYKNILLIKSMDEVLELGFPDGSNRYDGKRPRPHTHVICVRCKKIVDSDMVSVDDMQTVVASETHFKILNHRLDFFGICERCMAEKRA